ncbi:hypothetical protein B0O80DRAFT_184545 [Mortierella sp. GBAus27b]|nr:hypothetical protein B0O80DRAFT_184545 [Mortierella sp. GBAus27b]
MSVCLGLSLLSASSSVRLILRPCQSHHPGNRRLAGWMAFLFSNHEGTSETNLPSPTCRAMHRLRGALYCTNCRYPCQRTTHLLQTDPAIPPRQVPSTSMRQTGIVIFPDYPQKGLLDPQWNKRDVVTSSVSHLRGTIVFHLKPGIMFYIQSSLESWRENRDCKLAGHTVDWTIE